MHRIFYSGHIEKSRTVLLPVEESHHIKNVLRLQPGAEIELFNGAGDVARTKIVTVSRQIELEIVDCMSVDEDSGASLVVAQGLVKGKNMDLIIQKCTELGVSGFFPVVSSRSQQGYVKGKVEKRYQRWRRIIEGACGQCGRNRLMDINETLSFDQLLRLAEQSPGRLKLLFWEQEKKRSLSDFPAMAIDSSVMMVLGPEGGFTEQEVQKASDCGFQTVGLGRRILRAETAAIATVAIIQQMLGNMK